MGRPADLQIQKVSHLAACALLAALVTTGLFAAERAYRLYQDESAQIAAPLTGAKTVDAAAEPVPVKAAERPAVKAAERVAAATDEPAPPATQPDLHPAPQISTRWLDPAPIAARSQVADLPAPAQAPALAEPAPAAQDPVPATGGPIASLGESATPNLGSAPAEAAPQRARPKALPKAGERQSRRAPAKQASRERAAPQRRARAEASQRQARAQTPQRRARAEAPMQRSRTETRSAQARQPNIYYESDRQLGYAPQVRRRVCNPASGHMPMQCYYPREGRERFPAKSAE